MMKRVRRKRQTMRTLTMTSQGMSSTLLDLADPAKRSAADRMQTAYQAMALIRNMRNDTLKS